MEVNGKHFHLHCRTKRSQGLTPTKPKYWCKHCSTYVKDTKFERTQHEATGKHQGNLKRALRDIHRGHERDERDKNRAKAEIERLNRVVSGVSSPAPKSTPEPQLTRKPATVNPTSKATPEERKRQIAQLAEMGIAIPDEFRAEMAMAGEWKTVSEQPPPRLVKDTEMPTNAFQSIGVRKRKKDEDEDDQDLGEKIGRKSWGSTLRMYPGSGSAAGADVEALLARHRPVKSAAPSIDPGIKKEEEEGENDDLAEKRIKSEHDSIQSGDNTCDPDTSIKWEDYQNSAAPNDQQESTDDACPGHGIVFKKRKAKPVKQR